MRSDNELIEKYLQEYLLSHNSLIIQDLGKFEGHYVGATINPNANLISPPNKEIHFSAQHREIDDNFVQYIAQQENRSQTDVENIVKQFVTTLKIEISIQKKYEVKDFGTFFLTPDNELKFRQNENINFYAQGYGLPNIISKPITQEEAPKIDSNTALLTAEQDLKPKDKIALTETDLGIEDKPEVEDENPFRTEAVEDKANNSLFIGVLAVLFIVTAFFILAIFSGVDSINPAKWFADKSKHKVGVSVKPENSEENGEDNKEEKIEEKKASPENPKPTPKKEVEKPTKEAEPKKEIPAPTPAPVTPPLAEAPTATPAPPNNYAAEAFNRWLGRKATNDAPPTTEGAIIKQPTNKYYVVLGSFSTAKNAYVLYNRLLAKGFTNAKIIEEGGLYKVSYEEFSTESIANSVVRDLKTEKGIVARTYKY